MRPQPSIFALLDFFGVATMTPAPRRLPRRKRPAPVPNWVHRRQRPPITAEALRVARVALDAAAKVRRAERAARKHPRRHGRPEAACTPTVVAFGCNVAG